MAADILGVVGEAFREVLGVAEVDPDASFVELGGVSIEAMQLASRVSSELQVEVSAADVLGSETLRQFGELVANRLRSAGG